MPTKSKSSTTTSIASAPKKGRIPPIHPGEILREEFLRPLKLSANALALAIRVPATRVSEIINERRTITADTALRLARYFHMSPEFWMNLQSRYDLECARDLSDKSIRQDVRPAPLDKKTGTIRFTAA